MSVELDAVVDRLTAVNKQGEKILVEVSNLREEFERLKALPGTEDLTGLQEITGEMEVTFGKIDAINEDTPPLEDPPA